MTWYQGPTLIESLNSLKGTKLETTLPMRFVTYDLDERHGFGTLLLGKVLGASLNVGDKVTISAYYKRTKGNNKRYELVECAKVGYISGKRPIFITGNWKNGQYVNREQIGTYLVSISMKEALYVPTDAVKLI